VTSAVRGGYLNGTRRRIWYEKLGATLPIDFCVNLTLNKECSKTGFFCGETSSAHQKGCESVRNSAMVPCRRRFPIVITTNGGYPLDQNLYQSSKDVSGRANCGTGGADYRRMRMCRRFSRRTGILQNCSLSMILRRQFLILFSSLAFQCLISGRHSCWL